MIIAVLTILPGKTNNLVWYPAEVQYETLEEVWKALASNGCIPLLKLETKRRTDGAYVVFGREEKIVGVHGIVEITKLRAPVVEAGPADASYDHAA
jgi:hypothetical protein